MRWWTNNWKEGEGERKSVERGVIYFPWVIYIKPRWPRWDPTIKCNRVTGCICIEVSIMFKDEITRVKIAAEFCVFTRWNLDRLCKSPKRPKQRIWTDRVKIYIHVCACETIFYKVGRHITLPPLRPFSDAHCEYWRGANFQCWNLFLSLFLSFFLSCRIINRKLNWCWIQGREREEEFEEERWSLVKVCESVCMRVREREREKEEKMWLRNSKVTRKRVKLLEGRRWPKGPAKAAWTKEKMAIFLSFSRNKAKKKRKEREGERSNLSMFATYIQSRRIPMSSLLLSLLISWWWPSGILTPAHSHSCVSESGLGNEMKMAGWWPAQERDGERRFQAKLPPLRERKRKNIATSSFEPEPWPARETESAFLTQSNAANGKQLARMSVDYFNNCKAAEQEQANEWNF